MKLSERFRETAVRELAPKTRSTSSAWGTRRLDYDEDDEGARMTAVELLLLLLLLLSRQFRPDV